MSEQHVHKHLHHHSCCNGHDCGKCDCCKGKKHNPNHDDPPCPDLWPWIVLSLVLMTACALLGAALYWCWYVDPPPTQLAYHPVWCDDEPVESGVLTRTRVRASRRPSSEGIEPAVPSPGFTPTVTVPPIGLNETAAVSAVRSLTEITRRAEGPTEAPIPGEGASQIVALAIAEADGSRMAYEIRNFNPPPELRTPDGTGETLEDEFVNRGRGDGITGFYRLAMAYLDETAFDVAMEDAGARTGDEDPRERLFVPFCRYTDFFVVPDDREGFRYLALAELCNSPGPQSPVFKRWMEAIQSARGWSDQEIDKLKSDVVPFYRTGVERFGRQEFCFRIHTDDNPGDVHVSYDCYNAKNARQALKQGDALYADRRIDAARACWRKAIDLGKTDPEGAEAAITAQKRLQLTTTTCKWTDDSLAAISRDYKARSGDLIHVKVLQQSLAALGHYDGPIDGELTPVTRAAIRKFQREREEDETDTLTPLQTTTLVCNAAETTRDLVSETTLGIMYAVGLGVEQNVDKAQQWLTEASRRNYPDATYNLAVLYGTGIILNSYRLCDVPRVPEQADKYLQEAAAQRHPIAMRLMQIYGPGSAYAALSPRERWALIEMQQLEQSTQDKTGLYPHRIQNVGARCAPDRSVR